MLKALPRAFIKGVIDNNEKIAFRKKTHLIQD